MSLAASWREGKYGVWQILSWFQEAIAKRYPTRGTYFRNRGFTRLNDGLGHCIGPTSQPAAKHEVPSPINAPPEFRPCHVDNTRKVLIILRRQRRSRFEPFVDHGGI